jgi:alpha-ribazole phosphatase
MTSLIVIRHPPVLDRDLCYGQSNPPCVVSDVELRVLHQQLEEIAVPAQRKLWTSPAERCLLVTRSLERKYALQAAPDARLWELSMGAFEGKRYSGLEKDATFIHWMSNWQTASTPNGESLAQLVERVGQFCSELQAETKHLVVAHAGVIRALWVLSEGLSFAAAMKRPVPHLMPFNIELRPF